MFVEFFFYMRQRGLKVSLGEWMTLMEALVMGLAGTSLHRFYHLCRSICIKNEALFDLYDICFGEYFQGVEASNCEVDNVLEWLNDPIFPRNLTEEEMAQIKQLNLDELREQFEQRLTEQHERHDGGSHWVGTGGTSPFGHSGYHPGGVRIGGPGKRRRAIQVASQRRFRNLRNDRILDVRQIGLALRQLRRLTRDGRPEEINIEETISQTAKNAGELELVFQPERKNTVKLLLLMDVGGSMTPFSMLCERLFSAAHAATHFKAFKHYYFHNCPYETLFTDISRQKGIPTNKILQNMDRDWYCFIIGDAAMAPYELMAAGGAIDYFHHNEEAGIVWLSKLTERFPRSAWLNPEHPRFWHSTMTTVMIQKLFSMYPLTVEGLEHAIADLRQKTMEGATKFNVSPK